MSDDLIDMPVTGKMKVKLGKPEPLEFAYISDEPEKETETFNVNGKDFEIPKDRIIPRELLLCHRCKTANIPGSPCFCVRR